MFKLVKYLKNYKIESVIGPLFKLLEACFELLVPVVMAKIIDIGIKEQEIAYVLEMGGILVSLGAMGFLCSIIAQYFAAKAAVGFGTVLREAMFSHINKLSYTELDSVGTATLVTRITSDINQVQNGVNQVLRLFLRSPFIVLGAVIMAFTIHIKLAMIFVVLVPVLSLIIYGIMVRSIPVYRNVQAYLDKVLRITRENLIGVRVVRAFARQEKEQQEFADASETLMNMQLLTGRIAALLNPATYIVINGAILVVLWFGGRTVYTGEITQGQLIALINYMAQILLALVALANLVLAFTRALASAARINEVFARKSDMVEAIEAVQEQSESPKVSFEGVAFAYKENQESLSELSFTVAPGEIIGVIGGTGAGKSTLINLLPRFYDVTKGVLRIDGVDVKKYPFNQLRDKIGVVSQNVVLFSGTLRDNIRWGKADASDEDIYLALEIAQAKEFVEARPNGLEEKIFQGGKNLSGGQKQRLAIARALVRKPQILLLDDSASALDLVTDAKLRHALAQNSEGMTVFMVSQRVASVRGADRILVLEEGRMAGLGTHEELLEHCQVYKEICISQRSEKELV